MVGGYNFRRSEFNRAYQSKRQAGSTFKPFIYSAAIDKGYTPASIIVDSPIVFGEDEAEDKWKPEYNYVDFNEAIHTINILNPYIYSIFVILFYI